MGQLLSHKLEVSRRDFIFSTVAAGALTLTPRFAGAQAAKTYKLGVLMPSTGAGANYSRTASRDCRSRSPRSTSAAACSASTRSRSIYRDDQTKPDVGAREAKSLILNDKVDTIFGTYSSAVALAVQEIIHEHKVLHFAATSNSSKITQENYSPYTYQFCPDSNMQSGAVVVAVAMAEEEQLEDVRLARPGLRVGPRHAQGLHHRTRQDRRRKSKESRQLWFKLGETDFTSYITAIMAAKPDFMFGAIAGKDAETFMQQAGQMGLFKRVPFPGGLSR